MHKSTLTTSRVPLQLSRLWLFAAALMACSDTVDEADEGTEVPVLAGPIQWDPQSQMVQIASTIGCDSWTPTWAPDDNLYTAFGDCRPDGVPRKIGMGFG